MLLNINCNGRLLAKDRPVVMGILNATPDSFYTRGSSYSPESLLEKAAGMIAAGALLLDIGGMSTRPGSAPVSEAEESERVLPVISLIRQHFPGIFLSVDTYRAAVAREAVRCGADIVNDISAGNMDEQMIPTVAALGAPYIITHMKGTPADMQQDPVYEDVVPEVLDFFIAKAQHCAAAGIRDLILDPGFGFGKTLAHNYRLLKGMHTFRIAGAPVLVGISRKSMVYKPLGSDAAHALNGSTALHMLALQQGAAILRVHDVREAVECIELFSYYQTI